MRLLLERLIYHEDATIGRLSFPGGWCYTLEEPWRENASNVSCVPEGWYRITRDTFRGQYPNYRFLDVVGRNNIEIHKGNTDADTEGCVLLGGAISLGSDGQVSIVGGTSGPAFDRFMRAMEGTPSADLVIMRSRGPSVPPMVRGVSA